MVCIAGQRMPLAGLRPVAIWLRLELDWDCLGLSPISSSDCWSSIMTISPCQDAAIEFLSKVEKEDMLGMEMGDAAIFERKHHCATRHQQDSIGTGARRQHEDRTSREQLTTEVAQHQSSKAVASHHTALPRRAINRKPGGLGATKVHEL